MPGRCKFTNEQVAFVSAAFRPCRAIVHYFHPRPVRQHLFSAGIGAPDFAGILTTDYDLIPDSSAWGDSYFEAVLIEHQRTACRPIVRSHVFIHPASVHFRRHLARVGDDASGNAPDAGTAHGPFPS